MVLSEGMALVVGGLWLGAGCALVPITPALRDRAKAAPWTSLAGLLAGVVVTGLAASLMAIKLTSKTSVTSALKSD